MGSVLRRVVLGALGLALGALLAAPAAQAQFGIVRDDNVFEDGWVAQVFADDARDPTDAYANTGGGEDDAYPVAGTGTGVYELAGGHPYIGVTDFTFRRDGGTSGPPVGGNVRNLRVDIPRGLMPNPAGFDRCTDDQLESFACPVSSQIGTEMLRLYIAGPGEVIASTFGDVTLRVPLYNMTPLSHPEDLPRHEVPARFGFHPAELGRALLDTGPLPNPIPGIAAALLTLHSVHIVGGVRDAPEPAFGPADHGLYFTIDHLPAYNPDSPTSPGVIQSNLTFWGVPGDTPAHDSERGTACISFQNVPLLNTCTPLPLPGSAPDPDTPFLTNPTHCPGTSLISRLSVWSHTDASDQIDDPTPPIVDVDDGLTKRGPQNCLENVPFNGDVELDPGVTAPDTPSGPVARLTVQQEGLADRDLFATSHVKDVTVTLPPGLTLNPSVANGLQACTDAQLAANAGTPGGDTCPAASRIGDSRVISPLLPAADDNSAGAAGELTGSAYVGQPLVGDKYRLFVTLEGREVSIRLKGSVKLNPSTGQVTATFPNNPQLPFTDLSVDFRDGPRAPLATPLDCGPKAASALFTAWSGHAPVSGQSSPFAISGPTCPAPFVPSLNASTANPAAGAFSTLSVGIGRNDRHQLLSGVRVEVPPGFAGFISRVDQCPQTQAATGACPASSQIGTIDTAAGAGSEPYRLAGKVYLTERYKRGSSFGLVSVVRAIAGPYDLGTVVVRQSLFVNPNDAHITVTGDQLPRILDGVPIRLRSARVNVDRPGFAFNPTACGPKTATARLHSTQGTGASIAAPAVQINACERLAFKPRLAMRTTGRRQTTEGRHPGIRAVLKHRFGQSNIKRTKVALPRSLALDPENARGLCSYEGGLAAKCPVKSRIGRAIVKSPVLNRRLRGRVFFVQGIRFGPTGNRIRTLPTLLVKLRGEVRVNLRAQTSIGRGGRLVTTFIDTPDVPVKRFQMTLKGGKGGILVVTSRRSICGRRQVARLRMQGHSGKVERDRLRLKTTCPKKRAAKRRARS